MTPGLRLEPRGLLSKWGFADGDTIVDQAWAQFDDPMPLLDDVDTHAALVELVRRHVLPACASIVETVVMSTIHNPIRATAVDGAPVDWHEECDLDLGAPTAITVPWPEVLEVLARHRRAVTP